MHSQQHDMHLPAWAGEWVLPVCGIGAAVAAVVVAQSPVVAVLVTIVFASAYLGGRYDAHDSSD